MDIIDRHTMTKPTVLAEDPVRTKLTVAVLHHYLDMVKAGEVW